MIVCSGSSASLLLQNDASQAGNGSMPVERFLAELTPQTSRPDPSWAEYRLFSRWVKPWRFKRQPPSFCCCSVLCVFLQIDTLGPANEDSESNNSVACMG
jgi:hypothetical protein